MTKQIITGIEETIEFADNLSVRLKTEITELEKKKKESTAELSKLNKIH